MMLSQSIGEDRLTSDRMSEADALEPTIVSRAGQNWVLFELVNLLWGSSRANGHLHAGLIKSLVTREPLPHLAPSG